MKKPKKYPRYIKYGSIVSNYELDRIRRGLSRTGTEYGPLTDLPDWSFPDGSPGYMTSGQKIRAANQYELAQDAMTIASELTKLKEDPST